MIKEIYQTLQYFIKERIPEIEHITLYNNQFNRPTENSAFKLPAVLIEILPMNFDDLLNSVQTSVVKVRLHLGTEIYTSFDDGDILQDRSLEHLQLLDKLYIGLNRVNSEILPDEMKTDLFIQGGFKRTGVQINQFNSPINHSMINGEFFLFDLSAVKKYVECELSDINVKTWYQEPFGEEAQAKTINIS